MNYLENISLKKLITLIKTEIKTNTEDTVFCSEEDTEAAINSINADTLNGYTVDLLLDKIYPIGSIYMSLNSANPTNLFGGTWEPIKDTFLLAAGDSYEAGTTGGEAEHELTVEEMPEHEHVEEVNYTAINSGSSSIWAFVTNDSATKKTSTTDFYGFSNPSGGSQPHNNMPPYLSIYVWQRIQ